MGDMLKEYVDETESQHMVDTIFPADQYGDYDKILEKPREPEA